MEDTTPEAQAQIDAQDESTARELDAAHYEWHQDPASCRVCAYAVAHTLVAAARNHREGGATVWQGETADHGYLVGIPGHGLVVSSAQVGLASRDALTSYVAVWVRHSAAVETAATWGSWRDRQTGVLYFDVSSHHADGPTALTVAEDREELAIWDLKRSVEVRVEDARNFQRSLRADGFDA